MTNCIAAVKAIIFNEKKEFLILRQNIEGKVFVDIPGGKVEKGENPYETLVREVKEETDLDINIIKPIGMWWFERAKADKNQVICNTFLCEVVEKNTEVDISKNPSEDTIFKYEWISKEDFLKDENNHPKNYFGSLKLLIENLNI